MRAIRNRAVWPAIAAQIAAATGKPFSIKNQALVGGGCINAAYCIESNGQRYFVKVNSADKTGMFEAEAAGLREILATRTLRVPEPVCFGAFEDTAWLALEYVEMGSGAEPGFDELGEGLARMHRVTRSEFGWERDNTIGSTAQINTPASDWIKFWRDHRLGYQLRLAAKNGHTGSLQKKGERLMAGLDGFFRGYTPEASLLHGDLWGGNYGFDEAGRPVLFDPAVYYGDREADLAMTELFGGFSPRFYAAYNAAYPLESGYADRKVLYNLYHVLNHLNLFGGGYLGQAERMLDALLVNSLR